MLFLNLSIWIYIFPKKSHNLIYLPKYHPYVRRNSDILVQVANWHCDLHKQDHLTALLSANAPRSKVDLQPSRTRHRGLAKRKIHGKSKVEINTRHRWTINFYCLKILLRKLFEYTLITVCKSMTGIIEAGNSYAE